MQFEAKEDVECPIEELFEKISNIESFERSALRRGIDVKRTCALDAPLADLAWDVAFSFRGAQRKVTLQMAEYEPSTRIVISGVGTGLQGEIAIDLLALSPVSTRMAVVIKLKPKTLSARLLVQSLKLARSSLNRKFKARLDEFARSSENPKFENI